MQLKFVEVHADYFLNGKNFGKKLYAHILKMVREEKSGQIFALHNGEVGCIPPNNIATWVPIDSKPFLKMFDGIEFTPPPGTHKPHPMKLDISSAQVETPSTKVQNPMQPQQLKKI